MPRYHGPKEQLDAARSPEIDADVLDMLTESEYDFVRTAVAEHPNTHAQTLAQLVPFNLDLPPQQDLAAALAWNKNTPDYALQRLAARVALYLDNQRDHHLLFEIGVALCCHPSTPFDAIQPLLVPGTSASEFRKVVARETRREDVLKLLKADRSETVRRQALKTLEAITAAGEALHWGLEHDIRYITSRVIGKEQYDHD